MLQLIAASVGSLGQRMMFYLAAAVSDFYVPWNSMVMDLNVLKTFGAFICTLLKNGDNRSGCILVEICSKGT